MSIYPSKINELDFKPLEVNKLLKFLDDLEFNRIKASVISKFGSRMKDDIKKENSVPVTKLQNNKNSTKNYYIPEQTTIDQNKYELITDLDQLKTWLKCVYDNGNVAIDCETTSLNAVEAKIVGFSMSVGESNSCYIPLMHKIEKQINFDDFIKILKPLLEDRSISKIGQNIKYDFIILNRIGITLKNMEDTMLMSYVLRTGQRGHGLDELSLDFLTHDTIKYNDITTVGKKKIPFQEVEIFTVAKYASEDADVTYRLWEILKLELIKNKLYSFYFYIERPLISVIATMEINGFKINNNQLEILSSDFTEKILNIEKKIFEISDEKFNIGSPKQLGEILFNKLKLPNGKKGKSGNYQTDVKVLERLKSERFEIASFILDWRQFSKLKSTYCEGLIF